MEHNQNPFAKGAATDEPASPANPQSGRAAAAPGARPAPPDPPDPPGFAEPPLLSDALAEALSETLAETFPPGARKPRHDGWTPAAIDIFLRELSATGVVERAASAAGLTGSAAYSFRNRRQGRAFAKMWDAVLIHRTRARVASELHGRSIAGCVSIRKRDGVVVGEYHYYDNRLAMALLTRLDRLAEKEAASEAQLRALSEDLDDYLDCVAAGGDEDAFVEARLPEEPEPAADGEAGEPGREDTEPGLTAYAHYAGCSDYLDVDSRDIDVSDLDPAAMGTWTPDQRVRACRSGFMVWLDLVAAGPEPVKGLEAALCYTVQRDAARAATELGYDPAADPKSIRREDLNTRDILNWTPDQLARAWRSGLLGRLPRRFWENLAAARAAPGAAR